MLTDTAIRKAKAGAKPAKLADGGGLYLLLRPDGARWWRWDYRRPVTGKRNTLSLGTYPETGLAEARARHAEARKALAAGIDPGEQRKAEKAAGLERAGNSFEVVAREWLAKQTWVPGYRDKVDAWLVAATDAAPSRLEIIRLTSLDPDDLTLRAARLLGEADHLFHPADIPVAILGRARADAMRHVAEAPPTVPPPGLSLWLERADG